MSTTPTEAADETAGTLYGALAFTLWGVMPAYWRLLDGISPLQVTAHRVLWCAVFVLAVTVVRGHLPRILMAVRQPAIVGRLALTGSLITLNWSVYIYCVGTGQLVEASLGYYINPLISFALGFVFFGERMSRLRMAGVALAMAAVLAKTISVGHISWIAPTLALTFGFYGYFRKLVPIPAMDGLLVEACVLFPFALALVLWCAHTGEGAFATRNLNVDALLVGGGPLTAVPLALFAAGARRVRLSTIGFLQYLAPTITLLLAVFSFGEPFTRNDTMIFGCVWLALILVVCESRGWLSTSMFERASAKRPA